MSLRKTNVNAHVELENGYNEDEDEEDKYKAYADQQNAKIWTYVIIITLCIIVWVSALTSWILLRQNNDGNAISGSRSKTAISQIARAELAAAETPLRSEIHALKEELMKEEKNEARLLGKYEKLEKYTNELREQEKKLWTEENQRWDKISPELKSKAGKLPAILSQNLQPSAPSLSVRHGNVNIIRPAGFNNNNNNNNIKNTQFDKDPNAQAKNYEKITKGKSKLSALGKKIEKLNIKKELLDAKSDVEIEAVAMKVIESMSVEELIGSILVIGVSTYEYNKELDQCIRDGKIGGVFLHRDMTPRSRKKEIIKKYTNWLNERAALALGEYFPLVVASDDEGGHYNNYPYAFQEWPNNLGLAAVNDTIAAHRFGLEYGKELKSVGINVVFGPCMDVNIEPKNPVIGLRSFGSAPHMVGKLGSAVLKGFLDAGIYPTLKHFPGHGRTTMDSHISLPTIKANLESLQKIELKPFQMAIDNGAPMIMSGHLVVPALEKTKKDWPATFSKAILDDLLRKKMKFKGVIVTDSLSMQGAKKAAKSNDEGAVFFNSLMAGNDLLMDSTSLHCGQGQWNKVNKFLLTKIKENGDNLLRLKDAAKRVLSLRLKLRNNNNDKNQVINKPYVRGKELVHQLHRVAVTIIKDDNKMLPLQSKLQSGKKVVVIIPNSISVKATEKRFGHGKATILHFSQVVTCIERRHIIDALRDADAIIFVVHNYNISPMVLMHGIYKEQAELAFKIYNMQQNKEITQDILFISIENPYDLIAMPPFKSIVVGYGSGLQAINALWDKLFLSPIKFKKLPVDIPFTTEKMVQDKSISIPPSKDTQCGNELVKKGVPVKLNSNVQPTAGKPGESCETVCSSANMKCDPAHFNAVNNCNTLQSLFKCQECAENMGMDQPAQVKSSANRWPNKCLYTGDMTTEVGFHGVERCKASHPDTKRLCPCTSK